MPVIGDIFSLINLNSAKFFRCVNIPTGYFYFLFLCGVFVQIVDWFHIFQAFSLSHLVCISQLLAFLIWGKSFSSHFVIMFFGCITHASARTLVGNIHVILV
jgi:hypothetical protein